MLLGTVLSWLRCAQHMSLRLRQDGRRRACRRRLSCMQASDRFSLTVKSGRGRWDYVGWVTCI